MIAWITLTGADQSISGEDLRGLCERSPLPLEIALLVSRSKEDSPRYPRLGLAMSLAEAVREAGQRVAIHLCGAVAKAFLEGTWTPEQDPNLPDLLRLAGRVQVNAPNGLMSQENLDHAQELLAPAEVIFQLRSLHFPQARAGRSWLFDRSGGRGTTPSEWPVLPTDQVVGLAGGLGPGRVAPLLRNYGRTDPGFWIDMESSLRTTEDAFSREACEIVIQEILDHQASEDRVEQFLSWAHGALVGRGSELVSLGLRAGDGSDLTPTEVQQVVGALQREGKWELQLGPEGTQLLHLLPKRG